MVRVSRDILVAIFLLLFCGVFIWASFDIRTPDYGVLKPSTWPQVILGVMTFLCFIYLIQSIKAASQDKETRSGQRAGIVQFFYYWRNRRIRMLTLAEYVHRSIEQFSETTRDEMKRNPKFGALSATSSPPYHPQTQSQT